MPFQKTLLGLALCFLISPLFALQPNSKAPLWDHMMEVNAQWEKQILDRTPFKSAVQFDSEVERIRMHLLLVETVLRSRSEAVCTPRTEAKRDRLLDALNSYALQGKFPMNTAHEGRQPYFIDHRGTACAVGHLLVESGYADLAAQVRKETNYAYIRDMKYPELPEWASEHGFSVAELAWIQPGYPFSDVWTAPFSVGTNGPVTFLEVLPPPGNLVVTGDFDSAGSSVVNNAFFLTTAGVVVPMGTALEGRVYDVVEFDNNLWFGGDFTSNGGSNLAVYDPVFDSWTFEQVYQGVIYDLEVFNGKLYAGGDLLHFGGALVQHILEYTGSGWLSVGQGFDAPVRSLAVYNGQLYAGGEFQFSGTTATPYVGRWNGSGWEAVGTTNLGDVVRTLAVHQGELYAGGHLKDSSLTAASFGLAKISNADWEILSDTANQTVYIDLGDSLLPFIDRFQFNGDKVYVSGNFFLAQGLFNFGSDVAVLDTNGLLIPLLTPGPSSNIFDMVLWNNKILVGGDLTDINNSPAENLAEDDLPTATAEPLEPLPMQVYPNPVDDMFNVSLPAVGDWKGAELKLRNVAGKEMRFKLALSGKEGRVSNLRLPSGVYLLTLEKQGAVLATKAILAK